MKKLLFLIIIGVIVFLFFSNKSNIYKLLEGIEDNYADVNKYYVYGNHLNIEGKVDVPNNFNVSLVLKNLDNEISYDVSYNNGSFKTSKYINEGIYLDDIPIGDYLIFLKVYNDDVVKYYSLSNDTNYNDISYYTVTRNKKNNLININFSIKSDKKYMILSVKNTTVPDNYYDVVIDPGHGGDDSGAYYSKYTEANFTLDYSLSLKKELEKYGLKVVLTRVDDTYTKFYGSNSRTGIPYDVHAKYFISIHLNSADSKMRYGGVEIYAPNNSSLDFASSIASNIVKSASTSYSKNQSFNVSKGVYVRTFTSQDISDSIDEAKKNGYKPYSITTDTNYYFMLRETGGIVTGAYIDGRNKKLEKNNYYDSNIGIESYLLELGYINYSNDLNNLINNKNGYIKGIVDAFKEELKI